MSMSSTDKGLLTPQKLRGGFPGLPRSAVARDIGSGTQKPARHRPGFGPSSKQLKVQTPLRRIGPPRHIAGAVVSWPWMSLSGPWGRQL